MKFQYNNPVSVIYGSGRLQELGEYADQLGNRALVVTTGRSKRKDGLLDSIKKLLQNKGISSTVFADVTPNPKRSEINKGAAACKKNACDFVIGVGGGSSIDAAKAIAMSAGHKRDIWDFAMGCHDQAIEPYGKTLPIMAITTTSGTGSHVTPFSVVTNDETNEKPGIGSSELYPTVSIVDPELMVNMPKSITAATGFDILAHAIEAYTAKTASPITDAFCEKAIQLVAEHLPTACQETDQLAAREALAMADTFSGYAIANSSTTLCHSLAHAIGGVSHTVHGETLAAMTPYTVEYSMMYNPVKYQNIGRLLSSDNEEPTLEATIKKIQNVIKQIGLPTTLSELGVHQSDLNRIAEDTLRYMTYGVDVDARQASLPEALEILNKAL